MAGYSEKVMEHFMNPRNVGEIPDADGVGTVGNPVCGDLMTFYIKIAEDGQTIKDVKYKTFGCLVPQEKIINDKFVLSEIASVSKGDIVLDSEFKKNYVVEKYVRDYKGIVLKITPFVSPYNSFILTPNHPVLCIKRKKVKGSRKNVKSVYIRVDEEKLLSTEPEFIPAGNLEIGDYLIYPKINKEIDNPHFSSNMMKLLGYYLSEGYIIANSSAVVFAFNKNEKELISDLKNVVHSIINKYPKCRTRGEVTEVYVCSRKLAKLLEKTCGKLAKYKNIHPEVLLLPADKLKFLIDTYHLGDGDIYKRREKDLETYRIITTSENLAFQIQQVLAKCGIFASIREIYKTNCFIQGRKLKDSKQYVITFKKEKQHKFVHENENYFLVPIKKIEKIDYTGKVYNIQVSFYPNTYLAKGFVVHNCGAAIAVSSIVSEMAKGKTIDEVLKFTREMVAEELGGLPPQKMHCSNLGVDALHKAIEDYLSKKKVQGVLCKCPFCNGDLLCSEIMQCEKCKKKMIKCPNCGQLVEYKEVCSNCNKKL